MCIHMYVYMTCIMCACVRCHCQLNVDAQLSRDVLLTEFVQLYVQLRQVNRLIQGLFAAAPSTPSCLFLPSSFCARFVLHKCCQSVNCRRCLVI